MTRWHFRFIFLAIIWTAAVTFPRVYGETRAAASPETKGKSSMSAEESTRDLFDRWEQVWHEGKLDLVPSCVAETYIRHDQKGDRTVTQDAYSAEIANIRKERPGIRVVVYDHTFAGDRAWFRFAFKWTDVKTGQAQSQAGMQSYRIANGKLTETWISLLPLGSAWPDAVAQEHWTSPPPIK